MPFSLSVRNAFRVAEIGKGNIYFMKKKKYNKSLSSMINFNIQ